MSTGIAPAPLADEYSPSKPATIESIRIRGFRSLKDVEITDLPMATILIGANGSGKSNFIRFFEMLSWMLRSRRLREFVAQHGAADDQLFGGNRTTPRMEAEIRLRTGAGRNDYRFALSHASPTVSFLVRRVSDSAGKGWGRKHNGNTLIAVISRLKLSKSLSLQNTRALMYKPPG